MHNHVPYSWPHGLVWCLDRDHRGSTERGNGPHNSSALVDVDPELCCQFGKFFRQEEYYDFGD